MFRNLNTGIIKRLAVNSLKSDKKRNLFLILTIALDVYKRQRHPYHQGSS